MSVVLSENSDKKVHKHVAAIHCSGQLTLFQRKIVNCLLFNAYPTMQKENRFKIHIRELLNLMGLKNNDYRYIRETFKSIRKTDITWNNTGEKFISDNEGEGEGAQFQPWIDCSWLSWTMSDGSYIYYEFPAPLKEYLTEPSVYASISLKLQQQFTSKFALILYENCVRYVKIGKTKLFDIDTFRSIMGVTETQYKIFRDFNSRVLKPAITQVNAYSEINIEVAFKKVKRKVVSIQFLVNPKISDKQKVAKEKNYGGPTVMGISRKLIEQKAKPGETYDQAAARILLEKKKKAS